jgi:hypothetical protein
MKNMVRTIIEALVDDKAAVEVNEVSGSQSTIIEVRVSKLDLGKIIGKQGKTADAIRTLVSNAGAALQRRYILQILDNGPMSHGV